MKHAPTTIDLPARAAALVFEPSDDGENVAVQTYLPKPASEDAPVTGPTWQAALCMCLLSNDSLIQLVSRVMLDDIDDMDAQPEHKAI